MRCGDRGCDRGRTTAAHDEARRPVRDPAGGRGGGSAASVMPWAGSATAGGGHRRLDDEGDVHRPVGSAVLAELTGAVERVDDPHPLRRETSRVVGAFFREHGVVRVVARELGDDVVVREAIAHGATETRMCVPLVERDSQLDEQLTGSGSDRGRAPMVRRRRRHQRRTIVAAECSGD